MTINNIYFHRSICEKNLAKPYLFFSAEEAATTATQNTKMKSWNTHFCPVKTTAPAPFHQHAGLYGPGKQGILNTIHNNLQVC